MTTPTTAEQLATAQFRGPVRFYDGYKGMAQQDFECVDNPRWGYTWRREERKDPGRQYYTVDGKEVADFAEAARLLALPPAEDSPAEVMRKHIDEFRFSPKVGGATRALSEARCNGDAGPFGTVRAWSKRADNAWHGGINKFSDDERKAGRPWPSCSWLYEVKSATHETYRGMYLFEDDRKQDTGLQCAMGTRCRDCPILNTIEQSMVAARTREPFPQEIDDADIDAAKVWTCIGHILTNDTKPIDHVYFTTKRDREDDRYGLF